MAENVPQEAGDDVEEPDFPTKIADQLESVADKARSMTVDKAEKVGKWVAAGPILTMLGLLALIFFLIGTSRMLGEVVGTEVAYAIIGGLFLIGAWLVWRMRDPKEKPDA